MANKIIQNIKLDGSLDNQIDILLFKSKDIKVIIDNKGSEIANKLDITYIAAPIKKKERAKEKIIAERNGNVALLEDVVRCSFLCNSYEKMLLALENIRNGFEILLENDSMKIPMEKYDGYRRILLLVRIGDYVVEIQIMLDLIYDLKLESRELYLQKRQILAKKEIENRDFTVEDKKNLLNLKNQSIELYDSVIQKYNAKTSGVKLKLYKDVFC